VTRAFSHLRTRRQRRLVWLLLPALLLRALIPVGFMPLAGASGAYLGFCPGSGALPPGASELAAPYTAHSGHTHHDGDRPGSPAAPHHGPCVFSGGAATEFTADPLLVVVLPVAQAPTERIASLVFVPTILRAQSSRGPPIPG